MQENFLIGIGGTGSRVLEAFVHCCAAGFGPKGRVHLLMIDPDSGNGNLTRTKVLIEKYRKLRQAFPNREQGRNPAFQTELVLPPHDKPLTWTIFEKGNQTLMDYISYNTLTDERKPLADLADVLFTREERETELNEGFRGHPSIGALVMADLDVKKYPFQMLRDAMSAVAEAGAARIFLVGSIFGGTGAAGFATLGAEQVLKLNGDLNTELGEGRSKVLLGGALVLPYFTFKENAAKSPGQAQMRVTPQDFSIATKAALQFYNEKHLGIDQYYFIGDSLGQDVGPDSPGNASQENRPHYIELASALAAFDFFAQPAPATGAAKQPSFFIASRKADEVSWDQLPLTRDSSQLSTKQAEFKERITDFTLFAYTYLTVGQHYLAMDPQRVNDSWYRKSFGRVEKQNPHSNPSHDDNLTNLHKQMADYAELFLAWITTLDELDQVKLIDREKLFEQLAAGPPDPKKPFRNRLRYPASNNLGRLQYGREAGKEYAFYVDTNLNDSVIADGTQPAADKFLNIFFRAAKDFNLANAAMR